LKEPEGSCQKDSQQGWVKMDFPQGCTIRWIGNLLNNKRTEKAFDQSSLIYDLLEFRERSGVLFLHPLSTQLNFFCI
jgi:hypothetical protein